MLTDPAAFCGRAEDAFDVVVPDLPGYGFFDRPTKHGTIFNVNELWARLITDKLGYARFGAHGGDWGSTVTEQLGEVTSVPSWPLISLMFLSAIFLKKPDNPSAAEKKFLDHNDKWLPREGAYATIQSTERQSLAHGLNDSPADSLPGLSRSFARGAIATVRSNLDSRRTSF